MELNDYTGARGGSALNIVAGIWLLVSAFAITSAGNATANNVVFGILVAVMAGIRYFGAPMATWISWLNALFGVWTIISPWALGFSANNAMTTNNVIVGIVIAALGVWSAMGTTTDLGGTRRPVHTGA